MHYRALCVIVGLTLLATSHAATSELLPHHPAGAVELLIDGAPQRRYHHAGRWYVQAHKGREYAIRLSNPYGVRVAVALSVDGLNTIDARQTTAADARKWVLNPYQTVTISGWQTSQKEARRFEFTTEERSYGQALGKTGNLGIISAVFFKERIRVAQETAPAPEERPAARAQRDASSARRLEGKEAEAGIRGHRNGPKHRTRRRARMAGSRRDSRADHQHPLRISRAAGEAGNSAGAAGDQRSAGAAGTCRRVRARVLSRAASTMIGA